MSKVQATRKAAGGKGGFVLSAGTMAVVTGNLMHQLFPFEDSGVLREIGRSFGMAPQVFEFAVATQFSLAMMWVASMIPDALRGLLSWNMTAAALERSLSDGEITLDEAKQIAGSVAADVFEREDPQR